jgi:hypothetical protein
MPSLFPQDEVVHADTAQAGQKKGKKMKAIAKKDFPYVSCKNCTFYSSRGVCLNICSPNEMLDVSKRQGCFLGMRKDEKINADI